MACCLSAVGQMGTAVASQQGPLTLPGRRDSIYGRLVGSLLAPGRALLASCINQAAGSSRRRVSERPLPGRGWRPRPWSESDAPPGRDTLGCRGFRHQAQRGPCPPLRGAGLQEGGRGALRSHGTAAGSADKRSESRHRPLCVSRPPDRGCRQRSPGPGLGLESGTWSQLP